MVVSRAAAATIFMTFLAVQSTVAAEPLPSLGMPTHLTLEYDESEDRVTLSWQPPEDVAAEAHLVYEVQRNGEVLYVGPERSLVDENPGASAVYSVRAFDGREWGASAFAFYAVGNEVDSWPHCLNIIVLGPPFINWACILPLPP